MYLYFIIINLNNMSTQNPEQNDIIKKICEIQIDSLLRLVNKTQIDGMIIRDFLERDNTSPEEFEIAVDKSVNRFTELYKDPSNISLLTKEDMSKFKHILANIEDHYIAEFPMAINNIWTRINFIEKVNENPHITFHNLN